MKLAELLTEITILREMGEKADLTTVSKDFLINAYKGLSNLPKLKSDDILFMKRIKQELNKRKVETDPIPFEKQVDHVKVA